MLRLILPHLVLDRAHIVARRPKMGAHLSHRVLCDASSSASDLKYETQYTYAGSIALAIALALVWDGSGSSQSRSPPSHLF